MSVNIRLLILIAAIALSGFGAGWLVNGWRLEAKIATCRADSAERDSKADKEALAKIVGAADAVQQAAE